MMRCVFCIRIVVLALNGDAMVAIGGEDSAMVPNGDRSQATVDDKRSGCERGVILCV